MPCKSLSVIQVGEGSCKASKEGLGCSQEEVCISGGMDHDHPAHGAGLHMHASAPLLASQSGAAINKMKPRHTALHCGYPSHAVTVVNTHVATNPSATCE